VAQATASPTHSWMVEGIASETRRPVMWCRTDLIAQWETNLSIAVVMERIAETSPRLKARATGVFYLLTTPADVFAQMYVSGRLAAATAGFPDRFNRLRLGQGFQPPVAPVISG